MKINIVIINYGLGNIHSIENAIKKLGFKACITSDSKGLSKASHIILPGVGSFSHAMDNLKSNNMDQAIIDSANRGTKILGICLGMQLLCKSSEENGLNAGLGLIDATVIKFQSDLNYSVPQIQWNRVFKDSKSSLMYNIIDEDFFYFLHTYYVNIEKIPNNYIVGKTKYCGIEYVSILENDNITAVQFHPEKSADSGLKILENFVRNV